jgi:hypothetical protein
MSRKKVKTITVDGKRRRIKECACGEEFILTNNRRKECYNCKPKRIIKNLRYYVEHDPSDYPLMKGLPLSEIEIDYGLKFGSFVDGTIIRKQREKYIIQEGRLERI